MLASRWRQRITYVACDAGERLGLCAVLVRPDGVVTWAGETAPDEQEVHEVASRWFGEPQESLQAS